VFVGEKNSEEKMKKKNSKPAELSHAKRSSEKYRLTSGTSQK
jgi:hypothetical protein